MNFIKSFSGLGMAVLGLCLVACSGNKGPEITPTSYETMTVKKTDITVPVKYSARMKGWNDVNITPQVNGQLTKICVTEGQHVKKGQVLFSIDSRQAQLNLADAKANLEAAKANESSAELEYQSNKNLFDKQIVSSYMLNTALNAYNQAKAAVSQAQAAVHRAQVDLGFCTITSPVNGIVGNIPVGAGQQVAPSDLLTVVSGNERMEASFSITETELNEIANSAEQKSSHDYIKNLPDVSFVMKDGTEYEQKGRVITAAGVVDQMTGTVTCKASFPNPDGRLYSGIQGTLVMPFAVKDVMVIPTTATVRLQDKVMVYKVDTNKCATGVIVSIIDAATGKDVIVTSGLEEGDKIVTVGASNVYEGQQVIFE